MRQAHHLKRQANGVWHYYRRVPRLFASVDRRTFVQRSPRTRDFPLAKRLAADVTLSVEARWIADLRRQLVEADRRDPEVRFRIERLEMRLKEFERVSTAREV